VVHYARCVTGTAGWTGRGILYRAYQRRIRRQLEGAAKPKHVAMIVDGNRRWAKQLELEELVGIIADLAGVLADNRDWRVQHVGSNEGLPENLVTALEQAEQRTAGRTGLHVNLAVGYGGRREIADAMRSIVQAHGAGGGTIDTLAEVLTPELIGDHLYTQGQPDPDLVIRTSGEQRLSDFMLWQSAHSEFYFVEAFYPDLREVDFLRAVRDFGLRSRRFGG